MRVEVFDAATSEFRWGRQLPQRAFEITSNNGTIYAAGLTPNTSTSLVSFSTATDSLKHLGWIPKILHDNPVLMGPFGTVSHDVSGQAIAEAFEASDYVYYQTKGLSRDSMTLPTIRRRGAATEALLATAADTSKGREALFMSSVPMLTRFVNDSVIAVVHSDVELSNNLFIGKYYVSLIDVRHRRVCIVIHWSQLCSTFLQRETLEPLSFVCTSVQRRVLGTTFRGEHESRGWIASGAASRPKDMCVDGAPVAERTVAAGSAMPCAAGGRRAGARRPSGRILFEALQQNARR